MQDGVFVDTCIWASFFIKPSSAEKLAVDDLIDAGRVAVVGPLVAEVLLTLSAEGPGGLGRLTSSSCALR